MRRTALIVASILAMLFASTVLVGAPPPAVKISDSTVIATGITPVGQVGWFAFARERTDWVTRVLHWENLSATADSTGQAVLDLGRSVPVKSIFVAVDMTTGAFAASSPPEYPWASQVDFPNAGLAFASDKASVISLRDSHDELEVLVVRPRVGAWRSTVRHDEGPETEEPGVVVNFASLAPWGSAPPSPGALRAGDLIVAIDPNRFEYFAQQLPSAH